MTEQDQPERPVVDAYRHGSQLWIACPFCGAIHFHGPPAGHRVAHCVDGRKGERPPLGGYVLREVGARKPPPPSRRPRPWGKRIVAAGLVFVLAAGAPAAAQTTTRFYDHQGRSTGRAEESGTRTRYYDAQGRNAGRAERSGNSTRYYDRSRRSTGRATGRTERPVVRPR